MPRTKPPRKIPKTPKIDNNIDAQIDKITTQIASKREIANTKVIELYATRARLLKLRDEQVTPNHAVDAAPNESDSVEELFLDLKMEFEKSNDWECLLEGILLLRFTVSSLRTPAATWFFDKLRECVYAKLAQQKASLTRSRLSLLMGRGNDEMRLDRVLHYAGEVRSKHGSISTTDHKGVPITRAYELVAQELAKETGVHVTGAAIRLSCARALRRK